MTGEEWFRGTPYRNGVDRNKGSKFWSKMIGEEWYIGTPYENGVDWNEEFILFCILIGNYPFFPLCVSMKCDRGRG